MDATFSGRADFLPADRQKLLWVVFGGLIAIAAVASALFLRDKYMYGTLVLATPLALVVVCSPRLALYQFVFMFFFSTRLTPGLAIVDISALALVIAAALDTLLRTQPTQSIISTENAISKAKLSAKPAATRLFFHYLFLFAAVAITSVFAFDISLSLRPVLRILFIALAFLSIVRLLQSTGAVNALKFFFWLTVAHGCVAIFEFVVSGGAFRAFGLTGKALDDLTMLALPIGLAYFIGSTNSAQRTRYAIGSLIVFAALLATQSRAPIIFGVFGGAVTLFLAKRGLRSKLKADSTQKRPRGGVGRIKSIIALLIGLVLVVAIIDPDIIIAGMRRFERLITTNPGGTFRLRLTLWQSAWMVFLDNPLVGIGPGNFKVIGDAYSTLHLDPARRWILGLSAHNLLLHSLAESGLIGGAALLALFWRQLRLAMSNWKRLTTNRFSPPLLFTSLALASISTVLFVTTLLEAGWLWTQTGFVAAFLLALVAVNCDQSSQKV